MMLQLDIRLDVPRDKLPAILRNASVKDLLNSLQGDKLAIPILDIFIIRSTKQHIISLNETSIETEESK